LLCVKDLIKDSSIQHMIWTCEASYIPSEDGVHLLIFILIRFSLAENRMKYFK